MKSVLMSVFVLSQILGCGGSGGTDKPANTAGTSSSGAGGMAAPMGGSTGMTMGGSPAQGGAGAGGTPAAGGGGSGSGAGAGGSSGAGGTGGGNQAFNCPANVEAPKLTGLTVTRVEGVPPADDFNNDGNDFTNIEGPVWIGDALYVSEIASGPTPPSRVLKIAADGQVSVAIPDAGTNGLAVSPQGELYGALHKDGSISKLSLSGGAATPVVSMFEDKRFGSPNDLTFHSNGTIYFSDPSWQAPQTNPQTATRAYRVPPGGQPLAIEVLNQPNGMTLSKNQDFLYIGGNQLKKYPVMADGSLGGGSPFRMDGAAGGSDGMVIDCADNLYTTGDGVTVYSPAGVELGKISVNGISSVTNVAFGGADRKTLYITSQGNKDQKGVWKVAMNVPGMPY